MLSERRRRRWWLLGILAVAAILRTVDLGGRVLWCDELLSIDRASGTVQRLVDELLKVEHVPLYELSLRYWMQVSRSDAWIRLLSAIYGVATVWVVYLAFRRLGEGKLAMGVAALLAVSPLHVYWSRIARPYALLPLVAWGSTYYLLRLLEERNKPRLWVGYVMSSVLCLYTHYFGVLLLVAHNLLFFFRHWRTRPRRLWAWAGAQVLVLALFMPWLVANFATAVAASAEQQYYASQAGHVVKAAYFFFVFSLGWTVYPLNWALVVPAALVYGYAFTRGLLVAWRGDKALWIALVLFGAPLLAGVFIPACSPKHEVPGLPAYLFVTLCGIAACRQRWLRWGLVAAIVALDAASLTNYFRNVEYTDIDVVIPWRQIVAKVERDSKPTDGIILGYAPEAFEWYYRGKLPIYKFGDADFADEAKLNRLLRKHGRLWLVLFKDDPREAMEAWMKRAGKVQVEEAYQLEEETLRGLREGWRNVHKYRAYYYKLYLVRGRSSRAASQP